MSFFGSQRVRAGIITTVVPNPGLFTVVEVGHIIGPHENLRSDVSRALSRFINDLGWIGWSEPIRTTTNSRTLPRLQMTTVFWDEFTTILPRINLPEGDAQLLSDAISARRLTHDMEPNSPNRDHTEAEYLGRAALLGNRHTLDAYGWPSGMPGWVALITSAAFLDSSSS